MLFTFHNCTVTIEVQVMADFNQVLDILADMRGKVSALNNSINGLRGDIDALKGQIGSGTPVTQAQLDALVSQLDADQQALHDVAQKAEALDAETP